MVLHHPTPHSYQPPSPTNSTAPRPPTPSRSERLLRDALKRDEHERPPLPSSPLATHRRRHSHVPTSATVAGRVQAPSSPEQDREEYTRGTFLFRTAMNNPRSPSPGIGPTEKDPRSYYGGDAERSASPTPTTPRHHHHHPHSQHTPQSQQSQNQPQPHSNPRSTTRSTQSPSARSTSHSPSPMRHRRQAGGSLTLNRPPPLPLDNESPARRGKSPMNPRQPHQQAGPTSPGEPLVMTPHEQVLRARLERVLSVGRVVEKGEKEKEVERQRHIMRQKERRNRERSEESRGNEVRDEEGGWPWREQEREFRGVWGVEETATTTSPLYSSASNNSGSSGVSPALEGGHLIATPSRPSHNRTRSKTEPHSPPPRSAAVSPPRRSSTVPTPSRIPKSAATVSRRTGTTPPLVRGQPDNGHEADADDGDDDDDGDLRLLTPPPTPPFTARMFSYSLAAGGEAPYLPSPYKTKHSPGTSRAGAGNVGQTVGRKKSDAVNSKADGKNHPTKKAGLVLGSPRRPRNAPVHVLHSSSSGHEHENDDGGADASCSSSASSNSQASFPASDLSGLAPHLRRPPHSPPAQHHLAHRPQFNARKASERCRAMEGYVSFASVEGLGEPPADPMSPDGVVDGEDGVKTRGVLGLGAAGVAAWGGWRRLLGVAAVVGAPGHVHEDGQQQPGVVL